MGLTLLLCAFVFFTTCQTYSFDPPPEVGIDAPELDIIHPNFMQFANQFFANESQNNTENVVISPLSAYVIALGSLAEGAIGNTAQEIRDSLKLPVNNTVAKKAYEQLFDFLKYTNGKNSLPKIKFSNHLIIDDCLSVKSRDSINISSVLKEKQLDLKNLEKAVNSINLLLSNERKGDFIEIVKSGDSNNACLFLVNYMFFNGEWNEFFDKNRTVDSTFYTPEKNFSVPMMQRESILSYGRLLELNATFIEVPYKDNDLLLLIILPDEVDGLKEMEKKLESMSIKNIREKGVYKFTELSLPRFKVESTSDVQGTLEKMGIKEIFTDSAKFDGVSNLTIHLGRIFQKTVIEVNEGHIEIPEYLTPPLGDSKPKTEATFNVNHPFHFKIVKPKYSRDGIVLFTGNVHKFY